VDSGQYGLETLDYVDTMNNKWHGLETLDHVDTILWAANGMNNEWYEPLDT